MTKKHVLATVAAGALMLGATSLSAAPITSGASVKPAASDGVTQVKYKKHQARHHAMRARSWNGGGEWSQWGPLGLPFAAAEGAVGLGTAAVGAGLGTAGAIVGGTTAAVMGYPYSGYPYGAYGSYGYAPRDVYGSYAYAPGPYRSFGFAPDIGHGYYNGFAAPASQDNCAVDGGYGRRDYSVAC
ncbi:MAG: hypothetical protein ACJ8EU_08730 [Xanthobacteraceae bacterium]